MHLRSALSAFAFLASTIPLLAGALEPTLGQKGRVLLEEKFDSAALPPGWNRNTGELGVRDGVLRASERAADKHLGAFRKALPVQDCIVQVDFKLEQASSFQLGFDPASGELKKKGHLFSIIITPGGWQLTEHLDKGAPASKNTVHARAATPFAQGQWFTLLLELKGNEVVAHISGKEPLRASAPDFHVKKPGLVFRVGGKGEHAVAIDNVKVWELVTAATK